MEISKIAVGCDHAGFPYKDSLVEWIQSRGIDVYDFGTNSADSVDYPDFVHPVAETLEKGDAQLGIVLCGSGNGVAMTANKHASVRAAVCWQEDIAALARQHNNANVLAIPVRFIDEALALSIVKIFVETEFEGGRHARRVGKIPYSCA